MTKIVRHIEIVRSNTYGLSSMSNESAQALRLSLLKTYTHVGITIISTKADLVKLSLVKPDVVFNGVKYVPQTAGSRTNVWVSDYLEEKGVNVTGSTSSAHKLELDKYRAKAQVLAAGLPTARYYVAKRYATITENDITINYPVFIKPTSKGGGVGIDEKSVAHTYSQAEAKILDIQAKYNADSLVEEYLDGREFSIAILDNNLDGFDVMPLELIAPINQHGDRVLSSAIKSADTEKFVPVTDTAMHETLSDLALKCFIALGARGYGRIDIRMDADNNPYFLEANLIPSIIEGYGNFTKSCKEFGTSFDDAMQRIVELAFARNSDLLAIQDVPILPFIPLPLLT